MVWGAVSIDDPEIHRAENGGEDRAEKGRRQRSTGMGGEELEFVERADSGPGSELVVRWA